MSQNWRIITNQVDNTNSEGNANTSGYGQISVLLSKYVLKVKGKDLSTNDFTDNLYNKLESIETGAQVNKLETISINGGNPIEADSNKNINLGIPSKTSELVNDADYAKNYKASEKTDYSDSYVGKARTAFNDETDIAIGLNSSASNGGVSIGENTSTSNIYSININNVLKYNKNTSELEVKCSESAKSTVAIQNENGTLLTELDNVISNLNDEITNRENGDNNITNIINNTINPKIENIESKIPNQASSDNQLADKDFVNSSIQTSSSNFRGSWDTWSDVPTDSSYYPQDYSGSKIPTSNDYMVVLDTSDYPLETLSGTWRFKYSGDWEEDGVNGWIVEYKVNDEPLTSEQIYAINSGITSTIVGNINSHLENTNNPHSVTKSQVGLGNVINVGTDSIITENSDNNITSGAVYSALQNKMNADVTHLSGDVPITRTINGQDLSEDVTLTASDVGAIADDQVNSVNQDGYVPAPTSGNANKVWGTDSDGNPSWMNVSSSQSTANCAKSLNGYVTCSTEASVAEKTVTLEGFDEVSWGSRLIIYFENTNSATNPTLNVNGTWAFSMILDGSDVDGSSVTIENNLYSCEFRSDKWYLTLGSVYYAYYAETANRANITTSATVSTYSGTISGTKLVI